MGPSIDPPSVGARIRAARAERGLGLRELARRIGRAPSYLSDIELGRRVPTEDVIGAVASELGLDPGELMDRAGRIGQAGEELLRRSPAACALVRRIAEISPGEASLERLATLVERELGGDGT